MPYSNRLSNLTKELRVRYYWESCGRTRDRVQVSAHYASQREKANANMASNMYLIAAVLSIFSLMTVKEIMFPNRVQASNPDNMDRVKKAAVFTGPTIKFLYW